MEMRSTDVAVALRDVHKWYRVYASPMDRVKRLLGSRSRYLEFQALDGVTLEVPRGAAVGVIGDNGAGKSTLLKLVAGTATATAGTIAVDGSVAAILELGAAFHPEFTGRDNAVLYGALVGLDADAMSARLPAIIEFAELGRFIDHPVKSYSTGMAMRLAFAVATHVDPDVLVVDEALAVGDGYFQKKCVDRILAIKTRGTTILFCTHAMYYVTSFCDLAVWLAGGRVEAMGPSRDVVEAYEAYLLERDARRLSDSADDGPAAAPDAQGRIVGLTLDGASDGSATLDPGAAFGVEVEVRSFAAEEPFHVGVALDTLDGRTVMATSTHWAGREPFSGRERYVARLDVPELPLASGVFRLTAFLLDASGLHVHDRVVAADRLRINARRWNPALVDPPHRWDIR